MRKSIEDLQDNEELCDYCSIDSDNNHVTQFSNGCEGSWCDEAYDNYIDEFNEDISHLNKKKYKRFKKLSFAKYRPSVSWSVRILRSKKARDLINIKLDEFDNNMKVYLQLRNQYTVRLVEKVVKSE